MDEVEELIERFEVAARNVAHELDSGSPESFRFARRELDKEKTALTKALTVSPEKLEAAAKAMAKGPWDSLSDASRAAHVQDARAAAIALGLKVEG